MVSSRFTVPGEREAEPQLGQVMQGLVYGLDRVYGTGRERSGTTTRAGCALLLT